MGREGGGEHPGEAPGSPVTCRTSINKHQASNKHLASKHRYSECQNKTLGLVGFGRSPSALCSILTARSRLVFAPRPTLVELLLHERDSLGFFGRLDPQLPLFPTNEQLEARLSLKRLLILS